MVPAPTSSQDANGGMLPPRIVEGTMLDDPNVVAKMAYSLGVNQEELARMIAKEMVSTILSGSGGGGGGGSSTGYSDEDESHDDGFHIDLKEITAIVRATVDRHNRDETLTKGTRSLSAATTSSCASSSRGSSGGDGSSCDDGSGRRRGCGSGISSGASCLSDLSVRTGGDETAPVDIWHPDFWTLDIDDISYQPSEGLSSARGGGSSAAGGGGSVSVADAKSVTSQDAKKAIRAKVAAVDDELLGKKLEVFPDAIHEHDVNKGYAATSDKAKTAKGMDQVKTSAPHVPQDMKKAKNQEASSALHKDEDQWSCTGSVASSSCHSHRSGRSLASLASRTNSKSGMSSGILSNTRKKRLNKQRRSRTGIVKSVSFGPVVERRYERIMTDNPACSTGPSIGIGWGYIAKKPVAIDQFELCKQNRRPSQLLLSRRRREALIREWGYTDADMADCIRELNKLRYHRRQTVNNLGAQNMEEAIEKVSRKVKRVLTLPSAVSAVVSHASANNGKQKQKPQSVPMQRKAESCEF